jgi:transglutaminase-like putative cysteine protease
MPLSLVKNASFGDLVDGVKYLLAKAAASSEVKNLAFEITNGSYDKISDIYKFVTQNMQYNSDPEGDELFISPVKMTEWYRQGQSLQGDCDDFALFTVALAQAAGLKAHVSIVANEPNGDYDHAIGEIYSDKLVRFIQIDTSTNKVPLGWASTFYRKYDIE